MILHLILGLLMLLVGNLHYQGYEMWPLQLMSGFWFFQAGRQTKK